MDPRRHRTTRRRALLLSALVLGIGLVGTGCEVASAGGVKRLSPKAAYTLIQEQGDRVFVLDVRTPQEVAAGTLPGVDGTADWYRWPSSWPKVAQRVPKEQPILVYCRSGRRSAAAAKWLTERGYTVYDLAGGFSAWQRAGLPIVHR